mmetsp:Transcript_45616/g.87246  ORF Transcript_45616/g.87246 Transcript_45616/m.87246 type:complete len:373 (+) Transcript_45616:351-1469(+)|eukprot:CAMPEP_0114230588 /NCGR_PEP_ID=MMETSP0058-20121206/3556_1 /TAXON_ID=36894 /ORGANISM="Pyramimonas parkeae, CCMP726" /LENGTH=372 /DNA_ID=CAMNT_0001341811 /DNA_START=350 /DNA_END=1468 /DNA_ORIENTATION=-
MTTSPGELCLAGNEKVASQLAALSDLPVPYLVREKHGACAPEDPWSSLKSIAAESAQGRVPQEAYRQVRQRFAGAFGRVSEVELVGTQLTFCMKEVDLCFRQKENDKPDTEEVEIDPHLVLRTRFEWGVLEAAGGHPFVVTMYDAFLSPCSTFFCFVLDQAAEDMNELLARSPNFHLPEATAKFLAAEIVVALEHLHESGFVWRDLKLENVLIQRSGHVALADFDLAGAWPPDAEEIIHGGPAKGTVDYASPEVVHGQLHSPASDWWAFGVLMYEMLYGKRPFASISQDRTFFNITQRDLELPSEPQVSVEAQRLMKDLLRRTGKTCDPSKRLGGGGAEEVKLHEFFQGINFDTLHTQDARPYFSYLDNAAH